MNKRALMLVLIATLSGGCTAIKNVINNPSKENIEPPKALVEFSPIIKVNKVWGAKVGKGAQISGVRMAPAYADGRIYAASVNGDLEALDASNGKRLWRSNGKLHYSGGPSVANDLLVVGTLDGQVQALNPHDGSVRWQVDVSSEVISAPAIGDDLVVVRSHDGRVYGLDQKDGSRRWIYDHSTVPALSLRGNSPPVIRDGQVFYGDDNGKVLALRLTDGAAVWDQTLGTSEGRTEIERLADVDGIIAVESGIVYAASYRGQLAALLAPSGRSLWTRELSTYTGVAVSVDHVYVADADFNIWALDRRNGSSTWKQDALEHRWLSAPAVQDDFLVLGDAEGYVHWFGRNDGKPAARQRLSKNAIAAPPVVAGDTVYVEDIQGEIGAYRIAKP